VVHDELTSLPFPYRLEDEDDDEEGEEGTAKRVKFEDVLRVLEPKLTSLSSKVSLLPVNFPVKPN